MIERVVRNDEVVGLIPIWSTNSESACGAPVWRKRRLAVAIPFALFRHRPIRCVV